MDRNRWSRSYRWLGSDRVADICPSGRDNDDHRRSYRSPCPLTECMLDPWAVYTHPELLCSVVLSISAISYSLALVLSQRALLLCRRC